MKPIRVCFISMGAYRLFENPSAGQVSRQPYAPGGAELQIKTLAEAVAEQPGFESQFIVADFGQPFHSRFGRVDVFRGPRPPYGRPLPQVLWGSVRLLATMRRVRADIFVDSSASPRLGYLAFQKRLWKTPYIFFTMHIMDVDGSWEREAGGLYGGLYRWGLKDADQVLVQAPEHQRLLLENYGIRSEVFRNLFPAGPPPDCEKDIWLWVGRCTWFKRPLEFLRLARECPDQPFVMICPAAVGEQELHDKVRREAAQIPNLTWIDGVEYSESQAYYNRAMALVCTSSNEGLPNTFLQAAQACAPVLSLNVDPGGALEEHRWGFNARENWEVFMAHFRTLRDNPDLRREMGRNARRYLQTYHDVEAGARRFCEYVRRIIGQSSRRSAR